MSRAAPATRGRSHLDRIVANLLGRSYAEYFCQSIKIDLKYFQTQDDIPDNSREYLDAASDESAPVKACSECGKHNRSLTLKAVLARPFSSGDEHRS